jgi:hypothetical protein
LLACRNQHKAEAAAAELRAEVASDVDIDIVPLDLASLTSVSAAARLDDLFFEQRGYDRWRPYFQSKLANLLFTAELHRRLSEAGAGTIALAAHPGATHTDLGFEGNGLTNRVLKPFTRRAQPAWLGALPLVRAATAGQGWAVLRAPLDRPRRPPHRDPEPARPASRRRPSPLGALRSTDRRLPRAVPLSGRCREGSSPRQTDGVDTYGALEPTSIDVDRDQGVTIQWDDDHVSRFGLEELRLNCQCITIEWNDTQHGDLLLGAAPGVVPLPSVHLRGLMPAAGWSPVSRPEWRRR